MTRVTRLTNHFVNVVLSSYLHPYTIWHNKLTVLSLERKLKERGTLEWYMGFSHFEEDNGVIVFLRFPRYYKRSWKMRLTQLRQRFGRFIQNIGNRIAQ